MGCGLECLRGSLSAHVRYNLPLLDECLRIAPTVRRRVSCLERQQVLGWSTYGPMVNNWLQHFPLAQLMLISSSALENRTLPTLRKVEDFLGVFHASRATFKLAPTRLRMTVLALPLALAPALALQSHNPYTS